MRQIVKEKDFHKVLESMSGKEKTEWEAKKKACKDFYDNNRDIPRGTRENPTLAGAIYYHDEMWYWLSKNWHDTKTGSSTYESYLQHYKKYIFSELGTTCLSKATKEDYDNVMAAYDSSEIKKADINDEKAKNDRKRRDASFRRHLEYIMMRAEKIASEFGLCEDVLWGSRYTLADSNDTDEREKYDKFLTRLPKSFNPGQEKFLSERLLYDPEQSGYYFGLALMFCLGLRENEACGMIFGDIRDMAYHTDIHTAWISKSSVKDTRETKMGGKTRNAPRIIPIPDMLYELIVGRMKYLEDKKIKNIENLPIACDGYNYSVHCRPSELSRVGRNLLRECKVDEDTLSIIDATLNEEMIEDPTEIYEVEKDPTTYMLRRNLATHLYILGLDQNEIQYVMGHDISDPDDQRNYFRNEDKLYNIALKMQQRPLVNHLKTDYLVQCGAHNHLGNQSKVKLILPTDYDDQWRILLKQREPGKNLRISFPGNKKGIGLGDYSKIAGYYYFTPLTDDYHDGPVNVLTKYHESYGKLYKSEKESDNPDKDKKENPDL